MVTITEIISH